MRQELEAKLSNTVISATKAGDASLINNFIEQYAGELTPKELAGVVSLGIVIGETGSMFVDKQSICFNPNSKTHLRIKNSLQKVIELSRKTG